MGKINFVRFSCEKGHVSTAKYAVEDVSIDYCPRCGSESVEQLSSQQIDADLIMDSGILTHE